MLWVFIVVVCIFIEKVFEFFGCIGGYGWVSDKRRIFGFVIEIEEKEIFIWENRKYVGKRKFFLNYYFYV